MRTVESERRVAEIREKEPGFDPRACSGRTTRMLERVIDTVLDMRQDCIVVGRFERSIAGYLKDKMIALLTARGLEFEYSRVERCVRFNDQRVLFKTRDNVYQRGYNTQLNVFWDND